MEDEAQKHFSKIHFKPTFGSIEVDEENFILMRAESLSSEIYSVMLDLFGTQTVESTDLAHEFAINFIYDFGRNLGQSDQQVLLPPPFHFSFHFVHFYQIIPFIRHLFANLI
jgi:hypothetical protein